MCGVAGGGHGKQSHPEPDHGKGAVQGLETGNGRAAVSVWRRLSISPTRSLTPGDTRSDLFRAEKSDFCAWMFLAYAPWVFASTIAEVEARILATEVAGKSNP
jgi:hypothetical protein